MSGAECIFLLVHLDPVEMQQESVLFALLVLNLDLMDLENVRVVVLTLYVAQFHRRQYLVSMDLD